ncbi:hypothetical protein HALLA_08495 [Halostagnicola larsenii XH-48]|uniref:Uncharacterized protein n=1 Tax=Halostagnicola larsenii XH-48 TaxID=797299 RepID=W0JQ23_9EURY|nr:hypothetical protein HALLA_08495 [Halostagnicola larsenii XH-48]
MELGDRVSNARKTSGASLPLFSTRLSGSDGVTAIPFDRLS